MIRAPRDRCQRCLEVNASIGSFVECEGESARACCQCPEFDTPRADVGHPNSVIFVTGSAKEPRRLARLIRRRPGILRR